jgi:hypothetical protein
MARRVLIWAIPIWIAGIAIWYYWFGSTFPPASHQRDDQLIPPALGGALIVRLGVIGLIVLAIALSIAWNRAAKEAGIGTEPGSQGTETPPGASG